MEIIKGVHDLAFVAPLIAIALAPRAIATYLAVRKGNNGTSKTKLTAVQSVRRMANRAALLIAAK